VSKSLTLKGGFNSGYSSSSGYTTIQGLIIGTGSLTVDRLSNQISLADTLEVAPEVAESTYNGKGARSIDLTPCFYWSGKRDSKTAPESAQQHIHQLI
jgi:hypothetical protein